MSVLDERPSSGSWSQDILNKHRKVISWTPDAIVLFNGDTKIAGCNECKNKIDFQAFITSVGVSAGTSSGDLTASIEMSIPAHYGDSIFRDGEFIFTPGVEVNVYYRGFFEIDGLSPEETEPIQINEAHFDLNKVKARPYYPVFHGVTTSVSFSMSGGFYSASLSCNSLLHFWANQKVTVNAAAMAAAPSGSRGSTRFDGHVYSGYTPHQVIYDLYRDSGGSADGVSWVFSSSGNLKSKTETKESLFSLTTRYWETRFAQGLYGLRMYGASGKAYTQLQTAFLGDPAKGKGLRGQVKSVVKGTQTAKRKEKATNVLQGAKIVGLSEQDDVQRVLRHPDLNFLSEIDDKSTSGGVGLLASELLAFVPDIGAIGQFDLFDSQYESKQGIADQVAEAVGFEFFQDVDGDLVFKPPFYNLDTRASRVHTIKREDVIDISFENAEPEYTYAVCKGSLFRNIQGLGMEGTWGAKGTYVDYRLVAKFGWRPLEFDTTFYNSGRTAFFAAVVQLELKNVGMNTCNLSIPLRPELKPGYPIYVEHIDCFYYVTAVQHSFSFGGDCTTGLTLTARRKKFLPPGVSDKEGVKGVDLSDPTLPPKSLVALDTEGYRKTIGFPNVVMALDPKRLDPATLAYGLDMLPGLSSQNKNEREAYRNMLILQAYELGVLKLSNGNDVDGSQPEFLKGPWTVTYQNEEGLETTATISLKSGELPQEGALSKAVQTLESERSAALKDYKRGKKDAALKSQDVQKRFDEARKSLKSTSQGTLTIVDLIDIIQSSGRLTTDSREASKTVNIMQLLASKKSSFNPNQPGYYRYYSCSHPDPDQQGPVKIDADQDGNITFLDYSTADATDINQVVDDENGLVRFSNEVRSVQGFPTRVQRLPGIVNVPTKDIKYLSFQYHNFKKSSPAQQTSKKSRTFPFSYDKSNLSKEIKSAFDARVKLIRGNKTDKKFRALLFRSTTTTEPPLDKVPVLSAEDPNVTQTYAANFVAYLLEKYPSIESQDTHNEFLGFVLDTTGIRLSSKFVTTTGTTYTDTKATWKSVILPVSDENGYEVFGSYQYGRGLDIQPNVGFDILLRQDPTRLLNLTAIDEFLKDLTSNSERKKAYEKAAEAVISAKGEKLADAYFRLTGNKYEVGSEDKKTKSLETLANALMTQNDLQVVQNVPVRLLDIRPETRGNAACDCRGDLSDIQILLGDRGELPTRGGQILSDSSIVQSEKNLMASRAEAWKSHQDFLKGVQKTSSGVEGILPEPEFDEVSEFSEGALEYILSRSGASGNPIFDRYSETRDKLNSAYTTLVAQGEVVVEGVKITLTATEQQGADLDKLARSKKLDIYYALNGLKKIVEGT
jgi:hypothetical protein